MKSNNGPKKFTSVAEMKRRKEQSNGNNISNVGYPLQRTNSSTISVNENYGNNRQSAYEFVEDYADDNGNLYGVPTHQKYPLKSFNSSPDLAQQNSNLMPSNVTVVNSSNENEHDETEGEYSRPTSNRYLRPKTPPPPPPNNLIENSTLKASRQMSSNDTNNFSIYASTSVFQQNLSSTNNFEEKIMKNDDNNNCCISKTQNYQTKNTDRITAGSLTSVLPPPPPPLPPNLLSLKTSLIAIKPNLAVENATIEKNPQNSKLQDCRGISAEALLSVKLKPVSSTNITKNFKLNSNVTQKDLQLTTNSIKSPANFDLDLKSALAKRRSKVCIKDDDTVSVDNSDFLKKQKGSFISSETLRNEKTVLKIINNNFDALKEPANVATNIVG